MVAIHIGIDLVTPSATATLLQLPRHHSSVRTDVTLVRTATVTPSAVARVQRQPPRVLSAVTMSLSLLATPTANVHPLSPPCLSLPLARPNALPIEISGALRTADATHRTQQLPRPHVLPATIPATTSTTPTTIRSAYAVPAAGRRWLRAATPATTPTIIISTATARAASQRQSHPATHHVTTNTMTTGVSIVPAVQ
jgi:hypothetical protein